MPSLSSFIRFALGAALILWVAAFLYLRRVKGGVRLGLTYVAVAIVVLFGIPLLLPFLDKLNYSIAIQLWFPLVPVIFGAVLFLFSLLIFYVEEDGEDSPFKFGLLGIFLALGLCTWLLLYLRSAYGLPGKP